MFYLIRDGMYYEHQDISVFFESDKSTSSVCDAENQSQTIPKCNLVRQMNYICLYGNHIVSQSNVFHYQISIPFCKECKRFIPPRGYHCRHCDMYTDWISFTVVVFGFLIITALG